MLATLPFRAQALSSTAHNGLAISPALVQLGLQKGQTEATFTEEVTNDAASAITVSAGIDDFTALNATGTALFLNNTSRQAAPHGLAHWMNIEPALFDLAPGASKAVMVAITGAQTMAPGGHYGAVIFRVVPQAQAAGPNYIGTSAEVSSLVFLTTATGGTQAIRLTAPAIGPVVVNLPSTVNMAFTNTGDTQTVPRGLVTITDNAGHEVSRGIINTDSGQVLPSTSRLYTIGLHAERQFSWPGMYHLQVRYQAGNSAPAKLYTASFVYISQWVVIAVGALLAAAIVIILVRLRKVFVHYGGRG